MTFGEVLSVLSDAERWIRIGQQSQTAVRGPAIKGSRDAHLLIHGTQETGRGRDLLERIRIQQGADRIRAICEAESGSFDSSTLRKIRGRLSVTARIGLDEVDALSLDRFAELWQEHVLDAGKQVNTTDPDADLLAEILSSINGRRQRDLLKYLWEHPRARISALHNSVWARSPVQDGAVVKAAERLDTALADNSYRGISVKISGEIVVLTRPQAGDK